MPELSESVICAHDEAVERGEDGYLDPETGLFVMTSAYLRKRDRCCGSGCRHCPYDEETQRAAGRPIT
ncbi:MAG: DUF5522 domain-containing protein [Polyangiales bacterium]